MVASREKKEIRTELLKRLLSLTQEELKRRSRNVEHRLSDLPIYSQAKTVMAYYPLKGEVDILTLIRKDVESKQFCFPVMDLKAKSLRAFAVRDLDRDFVPGPFGVMEPDTRKAKEVDLREIDLVLVPGLGFDRQRNRLGRGGGFYDRFLKVIPSSVKKAGVAFEFQVREDLPIHPPLDQKVDVVVSENFII